MRVKALLDERNSFVHEGRFTGMPFDEEPAPVAQALSEWLDVLVT
jgi:hypothetical protein